MTIMIKGLEEAVCGYEYIYDLNGGDGFMAVYFPPHSYNCVY